MHCSLRRDHALYTMAWQPCIAWLFVAVQLLLGLRVSAIIVATPSSVMTWWGATQTLNRVPTGTFNVEV